MRKTTRAAAGAAPGSAPGAESSTGTGEAVEEWAMNSGSIHGKRREGLISRGVVGPLPRPFPQGLERIHDSCTL